MIGAISRTNRDAKIVIAIAGLSACGKTTLARDLAESLDAPLLQMDDYYKDITEGVLVEEINWDDPSMFHLDEWKNHLELLGKGTSVQVPSYDFCTSLRNGVRNVNASSVIIAEGQFALHPEAIPNHNCLNIFVHLPVDQAFSRRLRRDSSERGRSFESIEAQWNNHVLPAWKHWVEPSRLRADIELSGEDHRMKNLKSALDALARMQAKYHYVH